MAQPMDLVKLGRCTYVARDHDGPGVLHAAAIVSSTGNLQTRHLASIELGFLYKYTILFLLLHQCLQRSTAGPMPRPVLPLTHGCRWQDHHRPAASLHRELCDCLTIVGRASTHRPLRHLARWLSSRQFPNGHAEATKLNMTGAESAAAA